MKIAVFVGVFPVFSETFIIKQIDAFLKEGYEVDIYPTHFDKESLNKMNLLYLKNLIKFKTPISNIRRHELIYRIINSFIKNKNKKKLFKFLLCEKKRRWVLKALLESDNIHRKSYDIIFGQFGPNSLRALGHLFVGNVTGNLVSHFHGCDISSFLRFDWYKKSLNLLLKNSKLVVSVSNWMTGELIKYGCPENKIKLIPCGAFLDDINVSDKVLSDSCRFISVSRIVEEKGLDVTIQSFINHNINFPKSSLDIVGDGPLLSKCKDIVLKSGNRNIKFYGKLNQCAVFNLMKNSSVFVQHSKINKDGWREGWGVSIAEAAGAALPIISTNIGGIPDHVFDGKTGYLVEPDDMIETSKFMDLLAHDPDLRFKLGVNGRNNILQNGNLTLQTKKLIKEFKKVLNEDK